MKKKLWKIIKYLILILLIGLIGIFFYLFFYTQNVKKIISLNLDPIYVLSHDGVEKNDAVSHEEMSEQLLLAIVAAEDPNHFNRKNNSTISCFTNPVLYITYPKYFENVDGSSLIFLTMREAIRPLRSEKYKNNFLKSYLDECILAVHIEKSFSKKEVIELYSNEIYFLSQQNGVLFASQRLFNKSPSDLTLAESVIIASLPQAPTRYDPSNNELNKDGIELWRIRAKFVLRKMLDLDFINQGEFEEATTELEKITFLK